MTAFRPRAFTALVCALSLSACVTTGGPSVLIPSSAERPVSEMEPATQAQAAAKVHVDLGMAYLQLNRYDVALDEARIALRYDGRYAPAFHLMGLVHMFIDDVAAARAHFEQALSLAPNDPEFNNSYGWFQCTQGQKDDGLARLALAARNPYYRTPTRPHTNAGLCLLRMNDEAGAFEHFQKAVAVDPGNMTALFQLSLLAYTRGEHDLAQRYLILLHQITEPTPESAWLGLRTERRLENREAEASYAAQLKSRFPDAPETRLMMQGQFE
jgi:type IV pilus assembly protein PilF